MFNRFAANILSCAALALGFTVAAQAQSSRTFVATNGSDSNNCSATAPCRTFQAAIALTTSGGEIIVLNSGGYGPVVINQPITISAVGIAASITEATMGQNAIVVNTSGDVYITGLSLHGGGLGCDGVQVNQAGFLSLVNVTADDFMHNGVEVIGAANVFIEGSTFNKNVLNGLWIEGTQQAYVHNSTFNFNGNGVLNSSGTVMIADSSASYNVSGGFVAGYAPTPSSGGTLELIRDQATYNSVGVIAPTATSVVRLSYSVLSKNSTDAFQALSGGTITGTNPGTNVIVGATSGTLGTAIGLQ